MLSKGVFGQGQWPEGGSTNEWGCSRPCFVVRVLGCGRHDNGDTQGGEMGRRKGDVAAVWRRGRVRWRYAQGYRARQEEGCTGDAGRGCAPVFGLIARCAMEAEKEA